MIFLISICKFDAQNIPDALNTQKKHKSFKNLKLVPKKQLGFCKAIQRWPQADPRNVASSCAASLVIWNVMGTLYVILFSKIGTKWDEVGTKFVDCGTKSAEHSTKYNPEVIKYRPFMTNTHPSAALRAAEGCICSLMVYIWSLRECIS